MTRSCVGHLRLAGKARGRLQAPGLVEQVLLLLLGRLERVEALRARSRGRWCRRTTSRRRARCRCGSRAACRRSTRPGFASISAPCGQSACVRQHLELRHQRLPILLAGERALDAGVHAPRGELLGGAVQRLDRLLDGAVVRSRSGAFRGSRSRPRSSASPPRSSSARRPASAERVASSRRCAIDAVLGERARVHVLAAHARTNRAACARCRRRPGRRTA